jgi:hypothetical protein
LSGGATPTLTSNIQQALSQFDIGSWTLSIRVCFRSSVPGRGLEPLRISPPDPKSGASANFATLAIGFLILDLGFPIANRAIGSTGFSMQIRYGKNTSTKPP